MIPKNYVLMKNPHPGPGFPGRRGYPYPTAKLSRHGRDGIFALRLNKISAEYLGQEKWVEIYYENKLLKFRIKPMGEQTQATYKLLKTQYAQLVVACNSAIKGMNLRPKVLYIGKWSTRSSALEFSIKGGIEQ